MNNLNHVSSQPVGENHQSLEVNPLQAGSLNGHAVSSSTESSIPESMSPLSFHLLDLERFDQEDPAILQGEDSFPEFDNDDFFGNDDISEAFSELLSNEDMILDESEVIAEEAEVIDDESKKISDSIDTKIEKKVVQELSHIESKFSDQMIAELASSLEAGLSEMRNLALPPGTKLEASADSRALLDETVKNLSQCKTLAERDQVVENYKKAWTKTLIWVTPSGEHIKPSAEDEERAGKILDGVFDKLFAQYSYLWDDLSKPKSEDKQEEVISPIRILVYFTPERQIFSEERPVEIIVKLSDIVKQILKGAIDKVQESDRTQRADRERQEQLADDILKMVIKSGILKRQIMKGEIKQQELKIVVNKELFIPLKALVKIKRVAYKADHHLKLSIDSVEMDLPGQHKMRQMGSGVAAAAA